MVLLEVLVVVEVLLVGIIRMDIICHLNIISFLRRRIWQDIICMDRRCHRRLRMDMLLTEHLVW